MEAVALYEAGMAIAKPMHGDYVVASPLTGSEVRLKRDVDFGVVPKTKSPSLLKSGAEKICMAYGLMQRYSIESKIEQCDQKTGWLFYYLVRCDLVKVAQDGTEYIFTSGYGSANTGEKRNGFNGALDAANSAIKMAQKRSLVSAALSVSGLSDMFTQDMENETFMKNFEEIANTTKDTDPITTKQMKRIYAIGSEAGMNAAEVKNKLVAMGYASTKDITQAKYDEICEAIKGGKQ